jgi:hypothetical protein
MPNLPCQCNGKMSETLDSRVKVSENAGLLGCDVLSLVGFPTFRKIHNTFSFSRPLNQSLTEKCDEGNI